MRALLPSIAIGVMLASSGLQAAEAPRCAKVVSADMGWTDIALTSWTAGHILDALGYESDAKLLGLEITYQSLKNGDVDVFLGNWRPAQDIQFAEYYDKDWVEVLTTNLVGAKYTLAVPDYVAAAGVRSFKDLAAHADEFSKRIYGIEPGSNQPLLDMVNQNMFGLGGWEVVESGEQAMLAQVKRAVQRREWIVFMGWQPHPMNMNMKLEYLADGDDVFGADFGGSTVRTIARQGFSAECPNLARLFANLTFDIPYENVGMGMIIDDGMSPEEAALEMMRRHPEKVSAWLDGVTTRDGIPGIEAVKAKLQD
jgi:glycine betaine/proline transport system substrate-binding protein